MKLKHVGAAGLAALSILALPLVATADHEGSEGRYCSGDPYDAWMRPGIDSKARGNNRSEIMLKLDSNGVYRWARKYDNVICRAYIVRNGKRVPLPTNRRGGSFDPKGLPKFERIMVQARRPLGGSNPCLRHAGGCTSSRGKSCTSSPYRVNYRSASGWISGDRDQIELTVKGFERDDGSHVIVTWSPAPGYRICESVYRFGSGKADSVSCKPDGYDVSLTGWRITAAHGGSCEIVVGYGPQRNSIEVVDVHVTANRR